MKHFIYSLLEKFIIPKSIVQNPSQKIIHMTDTPSDIYPELDRLVTLTSPNLVIHTGDIVDDIKLELYPNRLDLYEKKLIRLNHLLSKHPNTQFIFVLGNHDHFEAVKKHLTCAQIYPESGTIDTFFGFFSFAHKFEDLPDIPSDYYLFGHSYASITPNLNPEKYINGLKHISIFIESPHEIVNVHYPPSTDAMRQNRRRRGF
jgi:3',5'-cyclic AMP phosphodiesterase CpdA